MPKTSKTAASNGAAPPFDPRALEGALSRLVKELHTDLRERCDQRSEVDAPLRAEYEIAWKAQRTLETFAAWREAYLLQVAVAWVLSTVFVRFLEERQLIGEVFLAGSGERARAARERHADYFAQHPQESDREYLQHMFEELSRLPGCPELFGRERNPLWRVGLSGDGAKRLREFWLEVNPSTGALRHNVVDPDAAAGTPADTRFLGDLYQNLSEDARKRYALLQTPDFVEEFILNYTLDPAVKEFGLNEVRLIDPTCGSGHFLLGAFHRLLGEHHRQHPERNEREAAIRALRAVHGVDINPFAVAIARFRLLVAFLEACGIAHLRDCPDVHPNVATGDSLLHGRDVDREGHHLMEFWLPDAFAQGDYAEALRILRQRYHAVVGNPPYITDKDKRHNEVVRNTYYSCHRQFSLGVPFTERFFDLALKGRGGFVGMITTNSFMKREFGSKLIEEVLPGLDLSHVLDTSGAYIPGHGTPTVVLFGRNRSANSSVIKAVLGIKGEPATPAKPAEGKVWQAIVALMLGDDAESAYVSSKSVERQTFSRHPWPMGGGGAAELHGWLEAKAATTLAARVERPIGRAVRVGEEDVFILDTVRKSYTLIEASQVRGFLRGENVRDYSATLDSWVYYPYGPGSSDPPRELWPWRTTLKGRATFSGNLGEETEWHFYQQHTVSAYQTPLSIAFAEIATHNHFVLDRGGKVFKQSAPVIKLPVTASEDDHLELLGQLNSSTACFWLKQVCFPKGGSSDTHGWSLSADDPWDRPYSFNATNIERFPVVAGAPTALMRRLQDTVDQMTSLAAEATNPLSSAEESGIAKQKADALRSCAIGLQEEIDWRIYVCFGLIPGDACSQTLTASEEIAPLEIGQRPFEILLAGKIQSGESKSNWFRRHNSDPITELPSHLPGEHRKILHSRIAEIKNNPLIQLIEQPEFKRRWAVEPWHIRQKTSQRNWLLTRLDNCTLWSEHELLSCRALAVTLRQDDLFLGVLARFVGRDDFDLTSEIETLAASEGIPYLAALRYTESGLRIRADWERTWELQRAEDAGRAAGDIPVPPKYASGDFLKGDYWRHRGKLDVPKERFILYPLCERDSDRSALLGWAGWNHLERAQALAAFFYYARENEGWPAERLKPLLAGLAELVPWLQQWHNEVDPEFGRLGDYYATLVQEESRELGFSSAELAQWRPPAGGGRKRKATATANE